MKRRVLAVCAMLALAGGAAHAGVWGNVAIISSTLGVNAKRLCLGEGSRPSDIGCPSYSPYVTSGGLLGVGTSSPTATLQVSGSFIVSSTGQTSSPSLYVGTNGNVGIGTTSPANALDVTGNIQATGTITSYNVLIGGVGIYLGNSNSWMRQGVGNSFGFSTSINMQYNQVIGFGSGSTNFYNSPLDTGFSRGAAGKVYVGNGTQGDYSGTLIAGNVGIGTSNPSKTLHVSGTVLTTSWTGINFSSTGNVTPTAPLEVSGTISATHFVGDGSGLTGVTAAATDRITSGSTQMVVVSNTGYVSLTQAGTNTGWFDPTRGLVTLGVSSTGPISGTGGYFSGNVGIGTTAPGAALHIAAPYGANGQVFIQDTSSGHTGAAAVQIIAFYDSAGARQAYIYKEAGSGNFDITNETTGGTSNGILFATNSGSGNQERMRVANSGNVGIGTTNPSKTLHVAGTVLTTSWTGINFSSTGNVTPTAPLEVSGTISATHFVGDGSGLTGVTAASSDRITSGTTQMVVVSNTGYVSLTQAGTNTGWFDPTRGLVTLGVSATGGLSGTTGYFSGNVGIGTTTPSQKLHVSGSVLTTSWTGINFSSAGNVTPTAPLEVSGTVSATHFVGDGSGLTNLSVQGDRITSGTASVVVAQNTGAEVSGTLKLTNTGSEVCDGAHINTLRINPTNGALEICQ